jgi:hypothetical protein
MRRRAREVRLASCRDPDVERGARAFDPGLVDDLLDQSRRARVLWSSFFSPVTISVRSVPALISDVRFATSSQPGWSAGAATSTTLTAPSRALGDLFHGCDRASWRMPMLRAPCRQRDYRL